MVLPRGSRFLVGRRAAHKPAPGYWTQVSGKLEPGESPEQALVREAMEEIGCQVLPLRRLREGLSHNGHFRLHYLLAELVEGEPAICDDELDELRWVNAAELRELSPHFRQDVELLDALATGDELGTG